MAKKDFYKILNIDQKASLKAIKSAYRQLALKYHPDHNPDNPKAAAMFNEIREAYEVLSSAQLRKNYDFTYTPEPVYRPEQSEGPKDSSPSAQKDKRKRKSNLRYNLFITLEDVAKGCERSIRYIRNNQGEKETVQLKVKVPKGAFHNQRLKLSGYGDITKDGQGDLFVIVHLQNHPIFLRTDLNLRVNVPISYLDAALGSTIEVPTLNGIRKLKLRACEFEELEYRMQGFGLPDPKLQYKGELLVHCFIEHPKKLGSNDKNNLQRALKTWPQGEMMQQYQSYLEQIKGSKK